VAVRGDLEGAKGRVSAPPSLPLLLASTSPQRRAILEQLGLPFDVVAPRYEELDEPGLSAVALVRRHAEGKARSVADEAGDRPVLGVDTAVVLDGLVYGLCVITPGWTATHDERTRVTFRRLTPRDLARYVASSEWEGRAGGYAVQGRGASLIERIEGDYLNVVGLPAAALVRLLSQRFAGTYGFG
jgi:nucleoside triphosphate pyrophosphatase